MSICCEWVSFRLWSGADGFVGSSICRRYIPRALFPVDGGLTLLLVE